MQSVNPNSLEIGSRNLDGTLFNLKMKKRPPLKMKISATNLWRRGIVVITTAQLHLTKPERRLCAGSNPARGVSEIRDSEDLWQWSRLEIRLNAFCWSTIPQKPLIIIIIIIIITM